MFRRIPRFLVSIVVLVCILFVAYAGAIGWFAPNEVKITEIAPGVFFRKAQTEPVFTGCNQGWVEFKDFVLVIDANFPGQAVEVIKLIRKQTDKPIRFVFDTHHHGDHADGNFEYLKIGATAVANERSKPLFETKGQEGFENSQKSKPDEYGKDKYPIPAVFFDRKMVFDDGTQRVEILHFGHGHTMGDSVAWLPRHGIMFTGDACVNGAFNYTGESNTETWIAALTAMADLPVKKVCPGHGEMSDASLLTIQRGYFVELRQAIRKLIDAGQSLDEIKQTLDIPSYKEWTGVDVKTRVENIEHVHKELTTGKKP